MKNEKLSCMVCGKLMYPQNIADIYRQSQHCGISASELARELRLTAGRQIAAGLDIVSDGCIARRQWDFDFYFGLGGIERRLVSSGHIYEDCELSRPTPAVAAPIRYNPEHPFFDCFRILQESVPAGTPTSVLLPAPAHFLMWLFMEDISWKSVYSDTAALCDDIGRAYNRTIARLGALGCRHIVLEDRSWQSLCSRDGIKRILQSGIDPHRLVDAFRDINDRAMENIGTGIDAMLYIPRFEPDNTTEITTTHCSAISKTAFGHANIGTVVLDMPDAMEDNVMELLQRLPADKKLVLGIIDGRFPQLECEATVRARIATVRKIVGDRLRGVTVIGGFKREAEFLNTSGFMEEDQWLKIDLLRKVSGA